MLHPAIQKLLRRGVREHSKICELWWSGRRALERSEAGRQAPGRILIDFQWIFFSPGSKSHGFSLAGDENLLIFLNFMIFADLLRIYKGGPFFRQIWHNWIPVGFGSKSIFESKGGGKLRSGSEFWYSEKISYYMMTFTTFFRDSESKAKKLRGQTRM